MLRHHRLAVRVAGIGPDASRDPPARQETILLVDDDAMVRRLAQKFLERAGYAILAADCGEEAIRVSQAHSHRIDLLLTDVVMPGLGGREVADRLKAARPDLKVLYMSGYTENTMLQTGVLDAGAVLLQKPFSGDALISKIRVLLAEPV